MQKNFVLLWPSDMRVIVVGCGTNGRELTRRLSARGHQVTLVAAAHEPVPRKIPAGAQALVRHQKDHRATLGEAGIAKAQAFVAVTEVDELNIVLCGIAADLNAGVIKIAQTHDDHYAHAVCRESRCIFGIDFLISADKEAMRAVVSTVEQGAISDVIPLKNAPYEIARFPIAKGSGLDGITLSDMRRLVKISFVAVAFEVRGRSVIPSGETMLASGMRLSVLCAPEHMGRFYELAGFKIHPVKKIALIGMSAGGTLVAQDVAEKCKPHFFSSAFSLSPRERASLVLVDKSETATQAVCAQFPHVTAYHGDVTDEAFFAEITPDTFDLVITTTNNYELNMITAAYMKTLGVPRAVALVHSSLMEDIAGKIGIDVAVSYQDVVVDAIMSHLAGSHVTGIHTIGDGSLEIVEFAISAQSPLVGKRLKDIAVHGSFLVLLISTVRGSFIPSGDTVLLEGSVLMFIVQSAQSEKIVALLGGTV